MFSRYKCGEIDRRIGFRQRRPKKGLGGMAMSWKEQTKLSKVTFLIGILCFFASIAITVLNTMGLLTSVNWLGDILDCGFWLAIGIAFLKQGPIFPIICFALTALNVYLLFL